MHFTMREMVPRMRKLHEIAKCGEGLRPELRSFYERLTKDPYAELVVRGDGMIQSGPDPDEANVPPKKQDDRT
jgi:hypothetical protein